MQEGCQVWGRTAGSEIIISLWGEDIKCWPHKEEDRERPWKVFPTEACGGNQLGVLEQSFPEPLCISQLRLL